MATARFKMYDAHLHMRINQDLLDRFKGVCGKGYQDTIRRLMQAYVEKYENIDKEEKQKRLNSLDVSSYIK